MHHGVIVNDSEPEHLLPLLDYMHQEPEEMPRLFLFTLPLLLILLLPIEFIKIQSNHSIQSSNAVSVPPVCPLHLVTTSYLGTVPTVGIYPIPLKRSEMTFVLILIYHLRHPSSRENKNTHAINDQTKRRSGGRALSQDHRY